MLNYFKINRSVFKHLAKKKPQCIQQNEKLNMHAVKMMSDLFTNVQVSLHTDGSGVEMCRYSFVELTYICPLCSLSGTMRLTWRSWRSAYARLRWTGFCGEHPNWCQLATASRSCRSTVWLKTTKLAPTSWRKRSPSLRTS